MELAEWLARARLEESHNLHKFNFEREKAFGCRHLDASHQAFADYLEPIDGATDSRSANEILWDYYAALSRSRAKLDDRAVDYRFLPPGLRMGGKQIFLKHLGIDPTYLARIGFRAVDIRKAEAQIAALLHHGPPGPSVEAELQKIAKSVLPKKPDSDAAHRAYRKLTPKHPFKRAPTHTFGTEPWWFTLEAALKEEESRLPKRTRALEKSGYVAGVRAELGLDNARDVDSDEQTADAGGVRFRILFQLSTSTYPKRNAAWRQPALFSGGIPHLFVSNPRAADGGRTVRLLDRHCMTHPSCSCAADGLPEGIVPGYVVMEEARSRRVRGIYVVLHRDLARYAAPSCDEIRARRAA